MALLSIVAAAANAQQLASPRLANSHLEFIPNRGQLADQFGKPMPEVLYTLDGHGVQFYFTKNSMHYVFKKLSPCMDPGADSLFPHPPMPAGVHFPNPNDTVSLYRVDAAFVGANPNVRIESSDEKSNYANFYFPWCPDGITRVPAYRAITYRNLYRYIDLVLAVTDTGMKYDFIVHPGGDPSAIRIAYAHASLAMDDDGSLHIVTPFGEASEPAPIAYQASENVECHFLRSADTIGFATSSYDRTHDLIIDPPRLWGTYYGGTVYEYAWDLGVDRHNNITIVGQTESPTGIATSGAYMTTLPHTSSSWSSFLATFDPNGQLTWATYYGGEYYEFLYGVACDLSCGKVAGGYTFSQTGIATSNGYQQTFGGGSQDGFLVSFDSNGTRRWGTYLGGSASDHIFGVAVDSANHIVINGWTQSQGLATSNAFQTSLSGTTDALIARLSIDGVPDWITYFGGSGVDAGLGVSCDASNHIYVECGTNSSGLATPGAYQTSVGAGAIAKFGPDGSRDWCTYYFPTMNTSVLYRLAVGRNGNLYCVGYTNAAGMATPGAFQTAIAGGYDGYIVHFDSAGHLHWATYYGANLYDYFYGVAVDSQESVLAAGFSTSSTGLASPGEYQLSTSGTTTAPFLVRFDSSGVRRWGTYYSDSGAAYAIGVDRYDHPVITGSTWAKSGVATAETHQTALTANSNAFVVRFCDTLTVPIALTPNTEHICPGTSVRLQAGPGLSSYHWSVNGASIPGATSSSYSLPTNLQSGSYIYQVTGSPSDPNVCVASSRHVTILVGGARIAFVKPAEICSGEHVHLLDTVTGYNSLTYSWTPKVGLDHPDSAQPIATPTTTTTYRLTVTDSVGCSAIDSETVVVHTLPKFSLPASVQTCKGSAVSLSAGEPSDSIQYHWSPTLGLDRTDSSTVMASPTASTTYVVTISDRYGCMRKDSLRVLVMPTPRLDAGPDRSICPGTSILVGTPATNGIPPYQYDWSPTNGLNNPKLAQPTAAPATTTLYTVTVTDKSGCTATDSVLVVVSDSLDPQIQLSGAPTLCIGDTITMSASGYSTYKWSTGETTPTIRVAASGDYFVTVSTSGGCTGTSDAIHVDVVGDSLPHPFIVASNVEVCEGDSVELRTDRSYASYRWSSGDSLPNVWIKNGGRFAVTVSNNSGCTATSDSITIFIAPRPSVDLRALGSTNFCDGDSVTLEATPGYSYEWLLNGSPIVDSTASITVKQSGTYRTVARNAAGCPDTSGIVAVHVTPRPHPVISGPGALCLGGRSGYRVTGASGGSILWQLSPASLGTLTGQGTDTITVDWENQQDAGTLTVSVAKDGCEGTASLPITIDSKLTPQLTADGPLAFCEGGSVTLDAGTGYATYEWRMNGSPIVGRTAHTLTVSQSATFTVFVTSAGGCSGESQTMSVTVYPTPARPIVTRAGNVLSSTAANQYQWSEASQPIAGETSQTFSPQHAGSYTVTITDANGCTSKSDPYNFDNSGRATVTLPGSVRAEPGTQVTLPLTLTDATSLTEAGASGYHAVISYNASLLAPQPLSGSESNGFRTMTVTGALPTPLPATPFVLQNLPFTATLGSDTCTDVTIDMFYFDNANVDVNYVSGEFCLSDVCIIDGHVRLIDPTAHITLSMPHPNPVTGEVTIDYELAEDGPTKLFIQDLLGRTALVIHDEPMKRGPHADHLTLSGLSSGSYHLILKTPSDTRTERMEIVR